MAAIVIRPGRPADVLACTAVWRDTVDVSLPAPKVGYHLYDHEIATGTLLVAEHGGEVIGFAGSVTRGERWFLADLFVSPRFHGERVGRQLFDALLATDEPGIVRATMASSDHRAITLYTRAAMSPQWPCFSVTARGDQLHRLDGVGGEGARAEVVTAESLLAVADIAGYPLDAMDLDYWQSSVAATTVVVNDVGGVGIGGAVVRWTTPFAINDPTAVTLGPVFAVRADDLARVVAAVLALVEERVPPDRSVRLFVPGPERAVRDGPARRIPHRRRRPLLGFVTNDS